METRSVTLVPAGTGAVLRAFGEEVTILIGSDASGGMCTQWLEITPPAGGPPPHHHDREDEWFHVLEGTVSFFDGCSQRWSETGPGGSVFVPRGTVHAFKNTGTAPSRMVITTTPGGFDRFFARCAEVFARPGPPDMSRILAIAAEHGIHFAAP